jgi:hypothetical protein
MFQRTIYCKVIFYAVYFAASSTMGSTVSDPGSGSLLPMFFFIFYSIIPGPGRGEGGWGGAAVSQRAGQGVPYSG